MPDVQKLIAVSVYGTDKPGIVYGISEVLAKNSVNIVDIEQSVLQGLFIMFIVGDAKRCTVSFEELEKQLKMKGEEIGVEVHVSPFKRQKSSEKQLYVLTVLGKDRVGITHDLTRILYKHGINIEKTSLTARDNLISIEFLIDLRQSGPEVKRKLKEEIEDFGLDAVIQPYSLQRDKRLIIFDMDSTIVDAEIIVELARAAGVEKEVEDLTRRAMEGELSFKEALKERVRLLKGLPVEVLEKIYDEIKLTEGAKELIQSLKASGYKVALVSGGFTYFTEKLKKELGLDYAFGNELEIENGKLTGRIKGKVIDSEEKARIIDELARNEGISKENIVAVGDGANDRIMIENAGLGIAFNAKRALRDVADGMLSKDNLIGLASVLKLPSEFKRRI